MAAPIDVTLPPAVEYGGDQGDPMPAQVTVNQAAESLGVSARRIRQFIEEGRLRATRIGGLSGRSGMYLIRQSDLDRFAAKPRQTGNLTGRPRTPKKKRK